jgi:hypothetical protein
VIYFFGLISYTLNVLCLLGYPGEIMVAIWWGTQADEVFPEAWQSDTGDHAHFRSKVYVSPKLWYLRVNIVEAQDLTWNDKSRLPELVCLETFLCVISFFLRLFLRSY